MKKVVLGISGGVDSAIAALLLKEQGYDVLGVSLKLWEDEKDFYVSRALYHQRKDAIKIACHLNIPWMEVDAQELFRTEIIAPFAEDYLTGKTPNPCINCNPYVKIHLLQEIAAQYDNAYIATGHYVGKSYRNGNYLLSKGRDLVKDQSYMLWKLSPQQIQQMMFPLADYSKSAVKKIATRRGLAFLAEKRESYNVCFLPNRDYREWLKEHYRDRIVPGDIIDVSGRKIGIHNGIAFHTIGEELSGIKGYGRMFVERIIPEANVLVAATKEMLYRKELLICNPRLYSPELFYVGAEVMVRIRGKEQEHKAIIDDIGTGHIKLFIPGSVFAPSPGQSAVFYDGDVVTGGGHIG